MANHNDLGPLRLNTSNQNKLKEFQRMFSSFGRTIDHTAIDLREILGTPLEVVQNKATEAGDGVVIEDTRYVQHTFFVVESF